LSRLCSPGEGLPIGTTGALKMTNSSKHLYVWAIAIQVASKKENFDCILVPSEIVELAIKKQGKVVKVRTAFLLGDFDKLSIKQLQKLALNNGITIARKKNYFIRLLNTLEMDVNLGSLKGSQLKSLITKHKIGALRSKEELVKLLKRKLNTDG